MDTPVIGIKIANGTFFPILSVDDKVKKRVILTPVSAGQTDVKIDIFRGDGEGMFNPVYVASLILNNIQENEESGCEIELLVGIDDENILNAEALDQVSGEKQLLSISLDAVDETDFFEIPDDAEDNEIYFNAEIADEENFDELSAEDTGELTSADDLLSEDDIAEELTDEDNSSFNNDAEPANTDEASYLYDYGNSKSDKKVSALKIAIVFLSIVFVIFLILLIYTLVKKPVLAEEVIKEETKKEVVIETADKDIVEKKTLPAAVIKKPAAEKKTPALPVKPAEPKVIRYKIKKGDTLWDISSAYLRTPWLYKKIAEDNNIKNPDLIFAGSYLNISE